MRRRRAYWTSVVGAAVLGGAGWFWLARPSLAKHMTDRAGVTQSTSDSGVRVERVGGQLRYTNRLIHEKSPYLQLHAHNPVDWFPWGAEAFETARREGKPSHFGEAPTFRQMTATAGLAFGRSSSGYTRRG